MLMAAALAGRGMPALAGASALGLLYLLVHAVAPAALGAGDVKLAVGAGALSGYFGVDVWLLAALAAPLLTAVWSLPGAGPSRRPHRAAWPGHVRGDSGGGCTRPALARPKRYSTWSVLALLRAGYRLGD